jgi:hypothetical protein
MLTMMRANPAPPDSREARLLVAYDALARENADLRAMLAAHTSPPTDAQLEARAQYEEEERQ